MLEDEQRSLTRRVLNARVTRIANGCAISAAMSARA